jgi:glycosyltransferase involved in cell wall biosynthesis
MSDPRINSGTSVIVSTYNEPECLCMVLTALKRQTVLPAEVLVADDGSPASTLDALSKIAGELPFRLVHVRQPHAGFRLARSRNNAIHQAKGQFIAFLDQDTLPHRLWLERYLKRLRPGLVCTGYVLRLSEQAGAELNREAVAKGEFERWHTESAFDRLERMQRKYLFYTVCRRLGLGVKGRPAIAFGNAAICRDDLIKVNGFDEEYIGWGQEDDDLGWRLYFAGLRPVPLVNQALVSHIHHAPRHGTWLNGGNVVRYRRKRTSSKCAVGLSAHPHPDVTATVL